MKELHLSESEIQDFVLNPSNSQKNVITHLETCMQCQAKAKQYRLLFTGITAQPQPGFDFDLSALVLASVTKSKRSFAWTNAVIYSLSVLGLFFIILALLLFKENAAVVFDGLKKMTLYLLLSTTLVIAVFLAMEIYEGYSKKMRALNFF